MERSGGRHGGSREERSESGRPGTSTYYERAARRRALMGLRPGEAAGHQGPGEDRSSGVYGPGIGQVERRAVMHGQPWQGGWSARAREPAASGIPSEERKQPSDAPPAPAEARRWGDPPEGAQPTGEGEPLAGGPLPPLAPRPPVRRRPRWTREPMTAGEIMTVGVRTVLRPTSVREIAEIMRDENCGIVPVVDEDKKLVGVVTERDIVLRGHAEGKDVRELKADDVMTADCDCVTADEEITEVIELMGKKQVRRIPVVDRHDRLLGIISMSDIASRADYDEELQEALERISARRSFWSRLWS
ncbi:MAG: CBS domain-containing protein [Deltaproteobacteria bacterium]|nr:CBS domain-containing protein [Deltaproteobacteria bacterium]